MAAVVSASGDLDTSTFNTEDAKYQADPKFGPDKESTWPFPKEHDGWMHAHNAIRGEIDDMIASFEESQKRGESKAWEVEAIKEIWKNHSVHVHTHHTSEDDILNPFFRTRIIYPKKLETDHVGLVAQMDKIEGVVKGLTEGCSLEELCQEMNNYKSIMFPHLKEEENVGLPLMRAYFEPKEVEKEVHKILKRQKPIEMGSFIYYMERGNFSDFRKDFMVESKIPGFVWNLQFKSNLWEFENDMKRNFDALKGGAEIAPLKKPSGCVII